MTVGFQAKYHAAFGLVGIYTASEVCVGGAKSHFENAEGVIHTNSE